jgi:hypothetical protein
MSVDVVDRRLPPARARGGRFLLLMLALFLLAGLWFQGRPEFVAWQLARDHKRGLTQRPGGRVWSSEPRVVTQWLEEHGTHLPPLPPRAGSASLVGARYCALVDRIAAHVVYEGDDSSVSLYVVTGPLRAPVAWAAKVEGLHLGFVRSAGRTLAIVGESEDDVNAALHEFTTTIAAHDRGLTLAFAKRRSRALHLADPRGCLADAHG